MSGPLAGKVCIVTGASRGIGKGIALQLGEAGATVYITGRTLTSNKDGGLGGSLGETAEEIEGRGGKCIPVQCDHSKDEDIKQLLEKVKTEQNGRLDVLVNNAFSGAAAITESMKEKNTFWEEDDSMWDTINGVGLRGHYLASVHAARLMEPAKQGLIINISSPAGLMRVMTTPFCIGKAACDRMAAECATDFRKHSIAFISLWPGPVKTEQLEILASQTDSGADNDPATQLIRRMVKLGAFETPEFVGKAIVHLATDPNIMTKSGRIVLTSWVGNEFGFNDINGKYMLTSNDRTYLACCYCARNLANSCLDGHSYVPPFLD